MKYRKKDLKAMTAEGLKEAVATLKQEIIRLLCPSGESASSLEIAERGLRTSQDLINLSCALIADLCKGSVAPTAANAVSIAVNQLLWVAELQQGV
jgi:hypothetical protein